MKILLASPRGFCAGVKRAIDTVTTVLEHYGPPIYVYHEVVHNRYVVEWLQSKGAIFVESLEEVPEPATLIFSAHGIPVSIREAALKKQLRLFDATCPLVHKVHAEVTRWYKAGYQIVMIGHRNHAEVIGTMGQVPDGIHLVQNAEEVDSLVLPDGPVGYVMQTTLSVDEAKTIVDKLKERFPNIQAPHKDDICYATQNRQAIIKAMAPKCDVILIVGSPNSSNSNRLREVAEQAGTKAYLIDDANEIHLEWFDKNMTVGISAGASAPEILVEGVIQRLSSMGLLEIDTLKGAEEKLSFTIPPEIKRPQN